MHQSRDHSHFVKILNVLIINQSSNQVSQDSGMQCLCTVSLAQEICCKYTFLISANNVSSFYEGRMPS